MMLRVEAPRWAIQFALEDLADLWLLERRYYARINGTDHVHVTAETTDLEGLRGGSSCTECDGSVSPKDDEILFYYLRTRK